VASVELARAAVDQLEQLIVTHSLPPDTRARLRRSLARLAAFPRLGAALPPPNEDVRYVLGPWRWLVVFYVYAADRDAVTVVAIEDVRARVTSGRLG
jgi:plasmid stabilization system protein ParE